MCTTGVRGGWVEERRRRNEESEKEKWGGR
jgi:hypothetical protein